MQIAGTECKICMQGIILASDGKICSQCQKSVHLKCETSEVCSVCGKKYDRFEVPKFNFKYDALVPRALRPIKFDGAALFVAVLIGMALLLSLFLMLFGQGH